MAIPNYKFTIDAPATVNKVKSIEFIPDITKGVVLGLQKEVQYLFQI